MVKVSELTGALLDYWVARAQDWHQEVLPITQAAAWFDERGRFTDTVKDYRPSEEWVQGGPLMAKTYGVDQRCRNGDLDDCYWQAPPGEDEMSPSVGDTPLQAICRAVVRAAFGDEVEEVGDV